MNLPEAFKQGDPETIRRAFVADGWVLVAVTDESGRGEEMIERLNDEFLGDALDNFACFHVAHGSAAAGELSLPHRAALYIFVADGKEEPAYVFEFDEPDYIFTEDIAQFLDDAASDILYGDELDLEPGDLSGFES